MMNLNKKVRHVIAVPCDQHLKGRQIASEPLCVRTQLHFQYIDETWSYSEYRVPHELFIPVLNVTGRTTLIVFSYYDGT
jgi:hypothetical protein